MSIISINGNISGRMGELHAMATEFGNLIVVDVGAIADSLILTMCYIVNAIQVFFSILIEHVLSMSPHNLNGIFSKENFA